MAKQKKQECPPPGAPMWLLTFGDMMSLLLTFFVMLVAYSNFESQKIKEAIISLRGALGWGRPSVNVITMSQVPFPQPMKKPPKEGSQEEERERKRLKIEAQLKKSGLDRTVGSYVTKEGIVLVALSPVFFDPGSAEIREDSYETLGLIADVLNEYENPIQVEGHTSNAPLPADSPFPSHWELSGARACAIARYFIDRHGVKPDRASFVGYGAYRPTVKSKTVFGRAHNERVEIKLITSSEAADLGAHLKTSHSEIPTDTEMVAPGTPEIVEREAQNQE